MTDSLTAAISELTCGADSIWLALSRDANGWQKKRAQTLLKNLWPHLVGKGKISNEYKWVVLMLFQRKYETPKFAYGHIRLYMCGLLSMFVVFDVLFAGSFFDVKFHLCWCLIEIFDVLVCSWLLFTITFSCGDWKRKGKNPFSVNSI